MNNDHTLVPDLVRVEYLRGYRDGLIDARHDDDPYGLIVCRIDQIDKEISKIETRTK